MKRAAATFLTAAGLLAPALHTSAQAVLGKHPADTVLPSFFSQNNNASTIVNGINGAPVKVTNVDWTLNPYQGSGTNVAGYYLMYDDVTTNGTQIAGLLIYDP